MKWKLRLRLTKTKVEKLAQKRCNMVHIILFKKNWYLADTGWRFFIKTAYKLFININSFRTKWELTEINIWICEKTLVTRKIRINKVVSFSQRNLIVRTVIWNKPVQINVNFDSISECSVLSCPLTSIHCKPLSHYEDLLSLMELALNFHKSLDYWKFL